MMVRPPLAAFSVLVASVLALAQQQPPPPQAPPIFRAGTNLVRVDVSVTDGDARPVTNLTADDFEVKEDDIPQTVSSFQFVTVTGESQRPSDESLTIRSREHAAAEAAREDVRVFVIFWDEYHIERIPSANKARDFLTKFVTTAFGPADLIALMDPLTPLDALEFTRDRAALARRIAKLEGRRGVYMPPRSPVEETERGRPKRWSTMSTSWMWRSRMAPPLLAGSANQLRPQVGGPEWRSKKAVRTSP